MIRYFNTGYFSRYLLIFFLAIVLWMPGFIYPQAYSGIISFGYDMLYYMSGSNVFIITVISFFITLLTAILLNLFSIESSISGKVSTLVMVLFVILSISLTGSYQNNPVIWINIIMSFVWINLMRLPNSQKKIAVVFNASFLIGIASLFYSQMIFMFILVMAAVFIHQVVNIRHLLVTIVGVITPYFFLLTWFYYTDRLLEESYDLFNGLQLHIMLPFPESILNLIVFFIIAALVVLSAIGLLGKLGEKNINTRRNLLITFTYFVIGLLIMFIFKSTLDFYLILSVPSAIMVSYWLSNVTITKWYNYTLVATLILIFVNQYYFLVKQLISGL